MVLDCLRPVLDALGLNEHSETGRLLEAMDFTLLAAADISELVLIHHMGHEGESEHVATRDSLDWPDATWTQVRQKPEPGEDPDPAAPRFFKWEHGRDS